MIYYLKTNTESEMISALKDAGILVDVDKNGVVETYCTVGAFDPIGTIYKETGNTIESEGRQIPETVAIDGFHANLMALLNEEQEAVIEQMAVPAPATPYRVWA